MSSQHLETERTYELDDGAEVPDLVAGTHGVVDSVRNLDPVELDATYVDTDELSLLARRVTLRRRLGGDDAGWHLKLPVHGDTRQEVHWPPGEDGDLPAGVQQAVTSLVLGRALRPVVSLDTTRHRSLLCSADGTPLAELCDDRVAATVLLDRPSGSRAAADRPVVLWREIEVELIEGDLDVLDAVQDALLAGGAHRSAHPSKLARALAGHVTTAAAGAVVLDTTSAGAAALTYLRDHLEDLREADLSWRLDEDGDGIHDLRVQARRLRAALTAYRPLFDEQVARRLQDELTVLGRALSRRRDLQVEGERLRLLLAAEDDAPAAASVASLAERRRSAAAADSRTASRRALEAGAYIDLWTDLESVASGVALSPLAQQPADSVLPGLLGAEYDRFARRAKRARKAIPEERTPALHDLRKAAKRLRYAAELAEPSMGKPGGRLRTRASKVQRALGEHGDAEALAAWADELSRARAANSRDGFVLGRLHAGQVDLALSAERDARRAVRRVLALG